MAAEYTVRQLADLDELALSPVLDRYGLQLMRVADNDELAGSYWGAPEAGLVGQRLYARGDTPIHSILHEACHFVCMPPKRRNGLHTDAGGDFDEENCVCFLQIVLADYVTGMGRQRMLADMDAWGYTFRLGSAAAWFENDADDARLRLQEWGLLDHSARPLWQLRGGNPDIGRDVRQA